MLGYKQALFFLCSRNSAPCICITEKTFAALCILSLQSLIGTIPTTASLSGIISLQLEIVWVHRIQRLLLLLALL